MKLRTRYTQRYPTAQGLVLDVLLFEGSGSKALDLSGKSNHGTIDGATWSRNEKGVCLDFDGLSDNVDCGNDESLNLKGTLSVEAQVIPSEIENTGYIVMKGNDLYGIYQHESDKFVGVIVNTDTTYKWVSSDTNPVTINQRNLVMTYDKLAGVGNMKLYHDGILDSSTTQTLDVKTDINPLVIGAKYTDTVFFAGSVGLCRIYSSFLSSNTIKRRQEQPDRDYCRGS